MDKKTINTAQLEADPPFCDKTSCLQLGYGIWVNLTYLSLGLTLGFPAVAMPQLKDDKSFVMTLNEEAMIVSVVVLLSPFGCLLSGIILDRLGRRISLVLCQIPLTVGWFYISFSKTARNIIIGRIISGLGIGMAMAAPRAYIAEISLPYMRGVLGALPNLAISIGLLVQATLGAFVKWQYLCYMCGTFASILLICYCFIPETPYYTLMKKNIEKTKKVLAKFRSSRYNIERELDTMAEFKTLNNIHSLSFCDTFRAMFRPSACKPFGISVFYAIQSQATGFMAVTTWAVEILTKCNSSVDAKLGNILLAVIRIITCIITSLVLYKVGRRPLALFSAIGVAAAAIGLGGYLYSSSGGVLPLILIGAYIALTVPGYMTLPQLMMFELLPLQVRGVLSGIILAATHMTMFAIIQVYPTMRDNIGIKNTFITYGLISLLGAIVLFIILPETAELTLQEIEEYFNHQRNTLVSDRKLMSAQLQHPGRHSSMTGTSLKGSQKTKGASKKKLPSSQKDSELNSLSSDKVTDKAEAKKENDNTDDDGKGKDAAGHSRQINK